MTNREFFNAIIEANINEALTIFAKESIAKLDAKNEKRSSVPSKTALANEPIKKSIVEFLANGEGKIASEIAETLDISTQKASSLCCQLVNEGKLASSEVKSKKGKVKAYRLA